MLGRKLSKFPFEIRNLEAEKNEKISQMFSDGFEKLVQVGPQKMLVPFEYMDEALYYHQYPFRENDVLIMGYPRSGTTMTQELLWLLFNDFNFKSAAKKTLIERVPLLESKSLVTKEMKAVLSPTIASQKAKIFLNSDQVLEKMTNRRVIKTHLHVNFLPKNILNCGCKIIYIARNPKDVVVSLYHLQRNSTGRQYTGSFEEFLELFMSDLTLFAPYWTHLKQAWQLKSTKNVLFYFYEDIIEDRRKFIKKILSFVGEKVTPFQLDILDFFLDFHNFKKYMAQGIDSDMMNKENVDDDFIRKGETGEWKKYFSQEMNTKMDKWIEENLQRYEILFPKGVF